MIRLNTFTIYDNTLSNSNNVKVAMNRYFFYFCLRLVKDLDCTTTIRNKTHRKQNHMCLHNVKDFVQRDFYTTCSTPCNFDILTVFDIVFF